MFHLLKHKKPYPTLRPLCNHEFIVIKPHLFESFTSHTQACWINKSLKYNLCDKVG